MEILLYLAPFTLIIGLVGLLALLWAIKNNQYEDPKGAAERILLDKDPE